MLLRCTQKLLSTIGHDRSGLVERPADAEDWYANLLWFDRRKCLLLTHAGTLLTIFEANVTAAALRDTRHLLATMVERTLIGEGLPAATFGDLRHEELLLARTADRSVLGCMRDMAFICEHEIQLAGGLRRTDIAKVNHALARNINSTRRYVPPIEAASARARARQLA